MSGSSRKSSLYQHVKRHRAPGGGGSEDSEGIELEDFRAAHDEELAALHSPINSATDHIFNMQKPGELERMVKEIWTVDFAESMVSVRNANSEIVTVLRDQTSNTTPRTEIAIAHKEHLLDGLLLNIVRGQSIHKVPVLTLALSIMCEAHLMKRELHDSISFLMKGALLAEMSVQKYMKLASANRPLPKEPMIPGVMVVTFDNLTMNVAYHAYSIDGKTGEKLDMTNWFAVHLPQFLAPTLDGAQACA